MPEFCAELPRHAEPQAVVEHPATTLCVRDQRIAWRPDSTEEQGDPTLWNHVYDLLCNWTPA